MLAGMVSGALDALEDSGQPRSLKKLFESGDGIAANSGGSCFYLNSPTRKIMGASNNRDSLAIERH